MNAKDLMIGSSVLFSEGIGKVASISWDLRNNRIIGIEGRGFRLNKDICDVSPMPLYVSMLERNGFKRIGKQEAFEYKEGNAKVYVNCSNLYGDGKFNLIINRISPNEGECGTVDINIRFVHELECAMRLCRIKKEIEP